MNYKIKIRNAILVGIVPAVLEGLLIHFADPATNKWVMMQSVIFWCGCGYVCYLIDLFKSKLLTSLLMTILLCLPWYIALSIVDNKPVHLLPLIISSIVMGIIIGIASSVLNKIIK